MELTVKHEKLENCQVRLNVEVPFKELRSEYDNVVREVARYAQISGFRKGKAPLAHIALTLLGEGEGKIAPQGEGAGVYL